LLIQFNTYSVYRRGNKNGSFGVAVIAARYGGKKGDRIKAKMQDGSAEHG
jgi:hypothetical protein